MKTSGMLIYHKHFVHSVSALGRHKTKGESNNFANICGSNFARSILGDRICSNSID